MSYGCFISKGYSGLNRVDWLDMSCKLTALPTVMAIIKILVAWIYHKDGEATTMIVGYVNNPLIASADRAIIFFFLVNAAFAGVVICLPELVNEVLKSIKNRA